MKIYESGTGKKRRKRADTTIERPELRELLPGVKDISQIFAVGVDEAGRGCLAGPVVAGAVILPESYDLPGLNDSKKLTARQRDILAPQIKACAVAWGLGVIWPREIDQCNILQATFRAMSRAVCSLWRAWDDRKGGAPGKPRICLPGDGGGTSAPDLSLSPGADGSSGISAAARGKLLSPQSPPLLSADVMKNLSRLHLVIDGNKIIPEAVLAPFWNKRFGGFPLPPQTCLVKGDSLVPAISAASVLAKTFRDSIMISLDKQFPEYGFAKHKGYGTEEHMQRIRAAGPCRQHRMTFAGVRPEPPEQGRLW